jgi:hypothetical protein
MAIMRNVSDREVSARVRNRVVPVVFGCLIAGLLTVSLWSQSGESGSSFSFPSIIASQQADGGIGIFNPSTYPAPVSLALTSATGEPVGAPLTLSVPALGQVALTASQLFGTAATPTTSIAVTSSTPGLVSYYQTFDANGVYMDGVNAARPALSLVFPLIPGSSADRTYLTLLNSTNRNTLVQLRLFSTSGTLLAQGVVQVVRFGTIRQSLSALFPTVSDFSNASHLTATGKSASLFFEPQPVSGTSTFFGSSSDIAALNAVPLTETFNAGVLPFFKTGSANSAILSVANVESASVDVNVSAVAFDGTALGSRRFTIPGNGGFRQSVASLFSLSGEVEGWILMQAAGRVAANVLNGRSDAGALSAVSLQKTPQYNFVFPQVVQGFGFSTVLSLVNPGPYTAVTDIYVVDPTGVTLFGEEVVLTPGQAMSKSLDKIYPELETVPQGILVVRSIEPLFASASIWSDSGKIVSTFSPEAVPGGYEPAAMKAFALSGTVKLNGRPAADFPVVLTGAANSTIQTAKDGSYLFTGLPAGQYSLSIEQYGFAFDPSVVNFELKKVSKRQNFEGFTAENSILIKPGTIPAASAAVTIDIFGRDFTAASVAYVGPVALDTTLIDSTHLRAVLPDYMVKNAAKLDVRIVRDGSETNPFTLIVQVIRPILTSVVSARPIVEGSPDAAITLTGTGFLPGAIVKINGRSDGIMINQIKDTEIIAAVPTSYFQEAGLFPVVVQNTDPEPVDSNVQVLTIYYPRPALESISPTIVPERLEDSAAPLKLDVYGYNFRRGAVVLFDGNRVPTYACEETPGCHTEHLVATVDPAYLRASGFKDVSVQNPDPSLDTSQILYLRVESLQPTITRVFPGSATVLPDPSDHPKGLPGYSLPILVFGTNFDPGAQCAVYQPGSSVEFKAATRLISSRQLLCTVEVEYPEISPQIWEVKVRNLQPGGGVSNAETFLITQQMFVDNPFLISLTPDAVATGGPGFTLTLNGTFFQPGTQVIWNAAQLPTVYVSSEQLRAEVPASFIKDPGKRPIYVTNPDNGGSSNILFVDVR